MSDSPKEPPDITYENDKPDDERPLFRDPLSRAHDMGLAHIKTKAISISDPPERRAVFKVTVTMRIEDELLGFVGHGDCDDKNTHALIAPHYIRMAETRAIARALRWATNEGRTCAEEMPSYDGVISNVDFVNKKMRTDHTASEDSQGLLNALERGDGAIEKAAKDDLLAKIERGEKILVNNATVQLMRKKLPKMRLHYNTTSDLRRYHAALRREYLKLHPDAKDTIV
jgi:hypothetical protein